jgi:hypothetical protein
VLKKESLVTGLLLATAAGAVITSVPAFAQTPSWGGCCSSSHSSFFHRAKNRNWNGNESENLNRIRLRLHNRNNNVAVARDQQEDRRPVIIERENEKGK